VDCVAPGEHFPLGIDFRGDDLLLLCERDSTPGFVLNGRPRRLSSCSASLSKNIMLCSPIAKNAPGFSQSIVMICLASSIVLQVAARSLSLMVITSEIGASALNSVRLYRPCEHQADDLFERQHMRAAQVKV